MCLSAAAAHVCCACTRTQYLTKRFLKNQQIRDFLRVVAGQSKDTYVLKYLEVPGADQEEES